MLRLPSALAVEDSHHLQPFPGSFTVMDDTQALATPTLPLPPLSAAFISADDAAYWAHEQIGSRRDREYGGAILKYQSRYFATTPIAGKTSAFTLNDVFSLGDDGKLVLPPGYACAAIYHSHPLDYAAYEGRDITGDERTLLLGFFSPPDMQVMIGFRDLAGIHYLSGPEGSLLKYVASGSTQEAAFLQRLKDVAPGDMDIHEDVIPQLADAGELSVLVANTVWGGVRGRVDKDWRMGTRLAGEQALHPFFSSVFPEQDIQKLLPVDTAASAQPVFGFVLKATGKDEYIAPVPAWERERLVPPEGLFMKRADGRARLPSNFRIDSIYCREQPKESWHQPDFFTPSLLATAYAQWRADPALYDSQRRLRLILQCADKAVLSYLFSGSEAEEQLIGGGAAEVEKQLKEGKLNAKQFVERVAKAGELKVLQVGTQWSKAGRVEVDYQAFEQLRKNLSPAFVTADDAARYLHERIRNRDSDKMGYVFERADGRFVSTQAIEPALADQLGVPRNGSISEIALPDGYRCAGFFVALRDAFEEVKRELGAYPPRSSLSVDEEAELWAAVPNFSFTISITAGSQTIPALYFSGCKGTLLKYVRSDTQAELDFSGFLKTAQDHGAVPTQLDGFDGTPQSMVIKMARVGELHVLVSSRFWSGALGKVPVAWQPFQSFTSQTPIPLSYSWVFPAAQSAAEYAHDQLALSAEVRQLAFILKHPQSDSYVVTQPRVIDESSSLPLFSPLRMFAADDQGEPMLPSGFVVHGVCYQSLPSLSLKPLQYWVYESFVDPGDLALAIAGSHETRHALREIYLSTRDNAQLRYVFSGSTLENQLYGVTPAGVVNDNGARQALVARTLSAVDFVKQVAAAGELSVRRSGELWDVAGVVDAHWKPFSRYPAPTFSASFLSADDAARWAHEQVGDRRDMQFCGHILKTHDQRFVATLPLPCRTDTRFVLNAVFATDHAGGLVVPDAYVMHGQYASCTAASLLDTRLMTANGWSREQACIDWQLFGDDDLYHIINNRRSIAVAYLSAAEDVLIAYERSHVAAEKALLELWVPDHLTRTPVVRRQPGGPTPELRVVNLAALSLRVVQGNRRWGPPGTVTEHWRAGAGLEPRTTPEQVGFGAIFSSARAAVKQAHARVSRAYVPTQTCFGFVLKHQHKEEYVVSEMVPADQQNPLFTQSSLFGMDDDSMPVYPSGFALHGLFYARRWLPETASNGVQWLGRHFLSSTDLHSAFLSAKRWRGQDSRVTLPVFISTLDGALLEFQTPVSTTLFDTQKLPSGQTKDVHTELASGVLSPRDFVAKVAALCWLSVIEANECWDEAGKLGADWVPYADFVRRALSPAFASAADAVRYAQARLGTPGNRIYGGLLLRRVDGLFVATEPLPVPTENFDPKWILPDEDVPIERLAPGMTIIARYRSRRDTLPDFLLETDELQIYRAMFSPAVLGKAAECSHLWSQEYLLGADGSIISFSCNDPDDDLLDPTHKTLKKTAFAQFKQDLAPSSLSPQDPHSNLIEQQLRDGRKTPGTFVRQVLSVASISVLQGSALWGSAQKLTPGWRPGVAFVAPQRAAYALADRTLGPVFEHMDDAARHAHEQAGERSELTFGFLFTTAKGQCVASMPVSAEGLLFPLNRIFLYGKLPAGFKVSGLYLCAPARQPEELIADPIYRSFIPPMMLHAALTAVKRWTANQEYFLPLYLSCADGALLKYQARVLESDWSSERQRSNYVRKLNAGFNPAEYPRKVARAGELRVLVTSEIWATLGPVAQTWTPRTMSAYQPAYDERLALGPVFSHPDDAARYMWRRCRQEPGKAWLGAILGNAAANTFLVTEPVDDSGPSVAVGLRADTPAYIRLFGGVMNQAVPTASAKYPMGYQVMGVQQLYKLAEHRTPLADRYQEAIEHNFIAQPEFRVFVSLLRGANVTSPRYYFTPRNGALLLYRPSYAQSEQQMLTGLWIDSSTGERVSTPSEVITTLSQSGRLHILEPDTFWQPRSQVAQRLLLELRKVHRP